MAYGVQRNGDLVSVGGCRDGAYEGGPEVVHVLGSLEGKTIVKRSRGEGDAEASSEEN